MRITRPQMFIEIARTVSKRATCQRLSVGAVVVCDNRPVSIGYNGVAAGEAHCAGNSCPGRDRCTLTTHAEENALSHVPAGVLFNANELGQKIDLYVTDSPCEHCAGLIIIQGVHRVFFEKPYRLEAGLIRLFNAGVEVYQITPAGYVMEWHSRKLVDI